MGSSAGSTSTSSTSSLSPQAPNNTTTNPSLPKEQAHHHHHHHHNHNHHNNQAKLPTNLIDLNDIYCYFPEMCTHQLNEVQDFTQMCTKLFQLEETIQTQKQVLSNLEFDLQRELNPMNAVAAVAMGQNPQQQQHPHAMCMSPVPASETPETAELRKEVTLSREQTRLQCKQLHDLDAKMRSNEHNLMMREQQLQQLLEELYIQEIYADNALEKELSSSDQQYNHHLLTSHTNTTGLTIPNGLVSSSLILTFCLKTEFQ